MQARFARRAMTASMRAARRTKPLCDPSGGATGSVMVDVAGASRGAAKGETRTNRDGSPWRDRAPRIAAPAATSALGRRVQPALETPLASIVLKPSNLVAPGSLAP